MISLEINPPVLERNLKRCQDANIVLPTLAQQKDPTKIPESIKAKLPEVGLWDINPLNLFRITWKNHADSGLFAGVNYLEIPSELSGVPCRIIGLTGKWFPTGAHKVGAAYGCLVPRLVTGQFDSANQKAVWPSTGNYCRGGAFDCALLSTPSVAILPEEMSRERFEWLKSIGAEVIATPGCESNVKEIYDKCWEIKDTRSDCVIFNQFEEFGNALWHYQVTGSAMEELFYDLTSDDRPGRFSAFVSATGSAGTVACGDYLRTQFPHLKVAVSEALQCPTLLLNGFGGHRIEGIGDKHIPWIHNLRNTDMVVAIDDQDCMEILRLFNEDAGQKTLKEEMGLDAKLVEQLPLMGISSICNLLTSIKLAKYFEFNQKDIIFTVFTDSADMYKSRINEMNDNLGNYSSEQSLRCYERYLMGTGTDHLQELNYYDQKKLHNLKYFTWVEQQGKRVEELNQLWDPDFWEQLFGIAPQLDQLIEEFNQKVETL